jgi:hypothetical protein
MTRATAALVAGGALAASAALPAAATAAALSVTTEAARDVIATGATLQAEVDAPTLGANVSFQYGTTVNYGLSSATVSSSLADAEIRIPVSSLQPATTYHVRAIATSGFTMVAGRDRTFTTGPGASGRNSGPGSTGNGSSGPSGNGSWGPGSSGSGSGASGSGSGTAGSGSGPASPVPGAPAAAGAPSSTSPASSGAAARGGASGAPPAAAGTPAPAPKPALGRTVAVAPISGTVTATTPSGAPIDLITATALPSGTLIDTRKGTVELTSALDRDGGVQTGRFWGALFEVRQPAGGKGMTQLVLRGGDFSRCGRRAPGAPTVARAARARKPPRTLWGSDSHGRFQTRGRGSVATVRGTKWVTEDRCDGTLTRVTEGAVAVYDLRRRSTTVVTKGHHHLARVAP